LVNGSGLSWRSRNTDLSVLDKICILSDQEAISVCHLLARGSGLLVGGSAGLVVCGSLAWLKQSSAKSALAIVPDSGTNYLDQIYNDEWLAAKGVRLLTREELDERLSVKPVVDVEQFCGRKNVDASVRTHIVPA